jgi:hypothetical protein
VLSVYFGVYLFVVAAFVVGVVYGDFTAEGRKDE